jgi:hypothetical protein
MQKLSRLRTLKGFGSIVRSTSTGIKATNPKPSDVGGSLYGSFTNLKITAGSGFILTSCDASGF